MGWRSKGSVSCNNDTQAREEGRGMKVSGA